MKSISALCFISMFVVNLSSYAGEKTRKPNSDTMNSVTIRCEGLNKAGIKIGMDAGFDPVDRLTSLTMFENESTGPVDIKDLASPSHFIKIDKRGSLVVFGFKTFNDGLEEDISTLFVAGSPKLSSLKLGHGADNLAIKQISCRALK